MNEQQKNLQVGVFTAICAYIMWGVLPLYWKLLETVPAGEVLAHRVVWSLVFMVIVIYLTGQLSGVLKEIRQTFSQRKSAIAITAASVFISINWFVFIYSVSHDKVIEASLGYYMNPLFNVLVAVLFLKERLGNWEKISFLFAFAGVLYMTLHYGSIPWVSIILAISFSVYGIIKKMTSLGAWAGLTIETLIMTPIACIYLIYVHGATVNGAFITDGVSTTVYLISAGAATAIPLLFFAVGAKRISFALIGFLQYIGPTIMLLLGIFLFNEPFSQVQLISFSLIWLGLIIFSTSRSRATVLKNKELKKAQLNAS